MDQDTRDTATHVLIACRERRLKIATAESCTGGLVGGALTDIAGSSDVFERGFITYSNEAKISMLGIAQAIIAAHGAVSRETAEAMAKGAIANSQADIAVAITGIAGPGGGDAQKPVGLVHFAVASRKGKLVHNEQRYGDAGRSGIRSSSVLHALTMLRELAEKA